MTGHEAFRAHVARQDMPLALLWVAVVYGTLAVVTAVAVPYPGPRALLFDLPTVAVMVAAGLFVRRPSVSDRIAVRVMSAVLLLLSLELMLQAAVFDEYSGLLYVIGILVVWGPVVLIWRAFVPPVVIVVVLFAPTAVHAVGEAWSTWLLAAVAAVGGDVALTYGRQRTIDSLHRARLEIEDMAVRDPLTGLLNRHGLEHVIPTLSASATREDHPLFACFVDLDDFKQANDRHGHQFGDAVLRAVAEGIRHVVRGSDIVARWGGDEFLVIGMGDGLDVESAAAGIERQVRAAGITPEQWPGRVSIGCASGREELDRLILEADRRMYRRKQANRSPGLRGGDGI